MLLWVIIAGAVALLAYLLWPSGKRIKESRWGYRMTAKIYRVIRITPGGLHAWCESSAGVIRKPTNQIPEDILKAHTI